MRCGEVSYLVTQQIPRSSQLRRIFMARRVFGAVMIALCLSLASVAAAANVTYVMKNGDRHSGSLVYHKDLNLGLIVNGQEQTYPISDIAAILYDGSSPSQDEHAQLPTSDNPPELERHMLVVRRRAAIVKNRRDVADWIRLFLAVHDQPEIEILV